MKLIDVRARRSKLLRWHIALYYNDEFTFDDAVKVVRQLGGKIISSNTQPEELVVTLTYNTDDDRRDGRRKLRRLSRGKPRFEYGPGWI